MSNMENCADCGKRFGFTERIFSKTNGLWICEDCNIKQIQENDNKDKKIAYLEEKLSNAIIPKFKIGQEVWWIDTRLNSFNEQKYIIQSYIIQEIVIFKDGVRYMDDDGFIEEEDLFATEEEAQAKLEELKNE